MRNSFIISIGGLVVFLALVTLLGGYGAFMNRTFGVYGEETRRIIQEESRAYNEGMANNLDDLCREWQVSGNDAIAASIRQRSAGYKGELPEHVQECVDSARNQ